MSSGSDDIWRRPNSPGGDAGPVGTPAAPPAPAWAGTPYGAQYGPAYDVRYGAPGAPAARAPTRLAAAAQVLLGVVVLVQLAGELPVLLHRRDLVRQIAADPGSVSLGEATRSDDEVSLTSLLYVVAFVATAIVFVIWFHHVRRNADAYFSARQRHSRGWAIGGWFCPVVNLWIPFQIAVDIQRAGERPSPGPGQAGGPGWSNQYPLGASHGPAAAGRAPGLGLLRAWWTLYLLNLLVSDITRFGQSDDPDKLLSSTDMELIGIVPSVLAAVLAIMVVRRMTATQQRRDPAGLIA